MLLIVSGCDKQIEEPPSSATDTPIIISDPTFSPAEVQWFDPNIQPEAYGVSLDFTFDPAENYSRIHVDVYNGGDLPIAYRYYSSVDVVTCNRMTIEDDRLDVFFEPFKSVFLGGVRGTAQPMMVIVEPGEEQGWAGSFSPASACSDIRQDLVKQQPSQWRACWGLVQLSSDYAPGGSREHRTGDQTTLTGNIPPILVCSPTADLPPDWYE